MGYLGKLSTKQIQSFAYRDNNKNGHRIIHRIAVGDTSATTTDNLGV